MEESFILVTKPSFKQMITEQLELVRAETDKPSQVLRQQSGVGQLQLAGVCQVEEQSAGLVSCNHRNQVRSNPVTSKMSGNGGGDDHVPRPTHHPGAVPC